MRTYTSKNVNLDKIPCILADVAITNKGGVWIYLGDLAFGATEIKCTSVADARSFARRFARHWEFAKHLPAQLELELERRGVISGPTAPL